MPLRPGVAALCVCAALSVTACSRNIDTKEAVQRGLQNYLATRPGLDVRTLKVEVASVSFRNDEADAVVSFKPIDEPNSQGMQMRYTLVRKGEQWVVKPREGAKSGNPHGEMITPPPRAGAPGEMPSGHPPVSSPSGK